MATLNGPSEDNAPAGSAGFDTFSGVAGNDSRPGGKGNGRIHEGAALDSCDVGPASDAASLLCGPDAGRSTKGGEGADTGDIDVLIIQGRANTPKTPRNAQSGTFRWANDDITSFANKKSSGQVPCFTPGTMIDTIDGGVLVEDLQLGQRVLTRDNGYQTVRWIGRTAIGRAQLRADPRLQPVRIAKGALGSGLPLRDMIVSPLHRMLITGRRAELLSGESEVLVAAVHLVGQPGITRLVLDRVIYLHVMFDAHEIILGDGAWTESFQPGQKAVSGLDAAQRTELFDLYPELCSPGGSNAWAAARLSLRACDARALFAA